MAVKIYSDVTKKFYDDEAAALKAEKDVKEAQDKKSAYRKEMAELVDAKRAAYEHEREAYKKAREEYCNALDNFCKEYGSYHYTMTDKNIADFFNSLFW